MLDIDLKSLINKLNGYSKTCLEAAAGLCVSRSHYEVTIEHLMLKLLEEPSHDFQVILQHYDLDVGRLQKAVQHVVEMEKTGNQSKPVFSNLLIEWIQEAWLISSVDYGATEIRSGMLICALLTNPRRFAMDGYYNLLHEISADDLRRDFINIVASSCEETDVSSLSDGGSMLPGRANAVGKQTALAKYAINFTERARQGQIDPVFCRDREIRQMIDILGRRRKNNPILVGEAGVGKTAVVEGLALRIVEGDVPDVLLGVDVISLDMGLLQAGASVKGEFEQRLKSVIEEVKSSPKPLIVFIDEAHTLIGAGGAAGGSDAANLLKPALARGEMRTMAATTWSEYKKYFEKDPALARRFQLVKVEEPSPENAAVIMRGLCEKYEQAHGVYIRDDAVVAAANLSARYISGRQLPDKAVDLLDTACARVKINISSKPDLLEDHERKIHRLEREHAAIRRDVETECRVDDGTIKALELSIETERGKFNELEVRWKKEQQMVNELLELRNQLIASRMASLEAESASAAVSDEDHQAVKEKFAAAEASLHALQADAPLIHYEVSPEIIGKVVSDWTGIPVGSMIKDEAQSVLALKESLERRIKGQQTAIEVIDRQIRASKAGLGNPNTPIAVLLFVGPSGVGKTESALALADELFGGERFVVTINMSEFQEKHTVSRLIGSPPGYVGYGEGGVLTEAVRQRPYSVVLLDEVEKADPEVLNLFYQAFDKGMLADGEGRVIDFKNTVFILTSNLASDIITQLGGADSQVEPADMIEAIRPVLSNHFKPALLARMEIVPYWPIAAEAMQEITRSKLDQLGRRVAANHKISFEYDDAVISQIAQRCTEVETGARNIDHIVNKNLLPQISTEILNMLASDEMPSKLHVRLDDAGEFVYQFKNE